MNRACRSATGTMRCSSPSLRWKARRSRSRCWSRTPASAPAPRRRLRARCWTITCWANACRRPTRRRAARSRTTMNAIDRLFARIAAPMDGPLLSISGGLLLLGLLTLYSASTDGSARITSQLFNVGIALAVMWMAAQVPPQTLMRFALPAYLLGLALLVAVALFGDVRNGARRWLSLGFGSGQPSEIMKVAMPLMLAWYFHKNEAALGLRDYLVAAALLAIPTLLIARQPDLGTALLVAAAGFYVIFLAGLSWKLLIRAAAALAASLPFLWSLMHDYQRRRILTLFDPTEDPLGAGYHIIP